MPEANGPPTASPQHPWLPREYFENQRRFPRDELLKYAGQYVAFNWEGDRLLASGADVPEVR